MSAREFERLAAILKNVSRNTERVAPGDRSAQRSTSSLVDIFGLEDEFSVTNIQENFYTYSPEFDGASGYITVPDDAAITDIFDGGGTVEFWIYPHSDGESDEGRVVDKGTWSVYVSGETSGLVSLSFTHAFSSTAGIWSTGPVIPVNKWTNITLVYDSDSEDGPSVVMNGFVTLLFLTVQAASGTRTSDSGSDLIIGNTSADAYTFDGLIHDVRLWNDSATAQEVKDRFFSQVEGDEANLVGYWPLEEGAGSVAYDFTSNKNHGTITASTYTQHQGKSIEKAYGLDFDTSYITVPHSTPTANIFSGGGTFEAIINPDSLGDADSGYIYVKGGVLINLYGASTYGIMFTVTFNSQDGVWKTLNEHNFSTPVHLAVVYDSDSASNVPLIYMDGVLQTYTTVSSPIGTYSTSSVPTYIGNNSARTRSFDGMISEVRIWDRELTPVQILANYNRHLSGREKGLSLYLRIDENYTSIAYDRSSNYNNGSVVGGGGSWSTSVPTVIPYTLTDEHVWRYIRVGSRYTVVGETVTPDFQDGTKTANVISGNFSGFYNDNMYIDADILNGNLLQISVAASRPAAGRKGVVHYATDTNVLSYDDGTNWNSFSPSNHSHL